MRGIDYSGPGSTVNRDPDTGIRYGIIHLHKLHGDVLDDFETEYDPSCPHCGADVPDDTHFTADNRPENRNHGQWAICAACGKAFSEDAQYPDEPSRTRLGSNDAAVEYHAIVDSSLDVWCFKSPYYTRAAFCSPCAPGACSLNAPCEDGERAYCFGHDWYDGGIAPYPVYSVATGDLVRSPDEIALEAADIAERNEMDACSKLEESEPSE